MQHLQQRHLALHAGRKGGDGSVEVDVEAAGEFVEIGADFLPAEAAEEADELAAGHVLVQPQLAGQVGDLAAGGHAVAPAVVAGDRRTAGGRPQEAEEQAQGRGLAGAVGTEKTEHLARRDFQVEIVEGAEAAVVLGQMLGAQKHVGSCVDGGWRSCALRANL